VGAILLMRHAEVVEETLVIRSSQRHLTMAGREHATAVGHRLRELGVELGCVVSSPLMRAAQTAELVAAALGFAGVVEVLPALAPEGDAHAAERELGHRPGWTLAVGHEPGLSAVGALLCRTSAFPPLHMTQVDLIEDGRLVWSLHPGDAAPVPAPPR